MSRVSLFLFSLLGAFALSARPASAALSVEGTGPLEVVISVADQRMAVLFNGGLIGRFPISTSKFGTGDSGGSYKTPLGRLRICEKLGDRLPAGTVIKHRQATSEVLPANAPGRDPIVTRILWLEGCEGQNANARSRSIYIHGTPEERQLGKPVSYGCIRMRSEDVISLFDAIPVGAGVTIISDRLPHYAKYVPPKPEPPKPEIIVAAKKPEPAPAAKPAAVPAPAPVVATKPAPALVAATKPAPAPAPAPIAALENPRRIAAPARTIVAEAPRRAEVAIATPTRHVAEVAANAETTAPRTDLMRSMHTSILLSGVDANSEIPQLQR